MEISSIDIGRPSPHVGLESLARVRGVLRLVKPSAREAFPGRLMTVHEQRAKMQEKHRNRHQMRGAGGGTWAVSERAKVDQTLCAGRWVGLAYHVATSLAKAGTSRADATTTHPTCARQRPTKPTACSHAFVFEWTEAAE